MKRIALLLSMLAAGGTANAASWSSLWLTPDQQAQRLLDSGKAADAARKFEDARRRAYAQIEAGQYAEAAQLLADFHDPQSQYNRGNALARAGSLENALAAYDDAIKQTTANSALGRDARRNRELVAEQLKQQQSSQSQSGGESQPGKQSSAANQSQSGKQDQSQAGNQSQSGKQDQSQSGKQDQSQAGNQSQPGKQDQSQAGNQSQPGKQDQSQAGQPSPSGSGSEPRKNAQQNATNGSGQQQDQRAQESPGQQSQQAQASAQRGEDSRRQAAASKAEQDKQDAAQAQRDVASTAVQPKPQDAGGSAGQRIQQTDQSPDRNGTPVAAAADQPPSEQTLALDQWLRQIPDDPGGLLRRKFLLEHLRRQRAQREPQ
ncbi:hypothetical protein [Povalibacter sp.]|uniref:hypothetical protein n=1 Tax=Povalibacter sp. TaxID=1962978 RepID=UPI002F423A2A